MTTSTVNKRARLIEREGQYDLDVAGHVVATFNSETVNRLPGELREQLLGPGGVEASGILSRLVLAGALDPSQQMVAYPEAVWVTYSDKV